MVQDIREKPYIDHRDIAGLNFIRTDGRYAFRRHYRQGLRSHIIEVLDPGDVEVERSGIKIDGILNFPKARPIKMLRIFRTRFSSVEEVLREIQRVKITEHYLTPGFVAQSIEMIVEYHGPVSTSPLLCGLQEYVAGVILDPWKLLDGPTLLTVLYDSLSGSDGGSSLTRKQWVDSARQYCQRFVSNTRQMIMEGGHIPDLAGIGNVLITLEGQLKLVDINNISRVVLDETIRLDDRNYPVCDKSIEALSLIEEKFLGQATQLTDPVYGIFLTPERKERVKRIEKKFLAQTNTQESFPKT